MRHQTEPSRVSIGCLFYFSECSHQADNTAPVWELCTECLDKTTASPKKHKQPQKKENHEIKDNKQQRETHTQNLLVFMSHSSLPVSSSQLWESAAVHPLLENHRGAIFLAAPVPRAGAAHCTNERIFFFFFFLQSRKPNLRSKCCEACKQRRLQKPSR